MIRRFLTLFAALLLAGCAAAPFPPPQAVPVPRGVDAAQLAAHCWLAQEGVFRLQQRAEFDFRGRKLQMLGLMELDTAAGRARLVAVNEMGITLFDLTVTRSGQTLNSVLPQLASYPRLAEGVASSVRRIFLAPLPAAGDRLSSSATSCVLERPWEGGTLRFTFGGAAPRLRQTRVAGTTDEWQVDYYQYRRQAGTSYPAGIVLADARAGYRLTLWLDNVRRIK